jgi:hypothetical protein
VFDPGSVLAATRPNSWFDRSLHTTTQVTGHERVCGLVGSAKSRLFVEVQCTAVGLPCSFCRWGEHIHGSGHLLSVSILCGPDGRCWPLAVSGSSTVTGWALVHVLGESWLWHQGAGSPLRLLSASVCCQGLESSIGSRTVFVCEGSLSAVSHLCHSVLGKPV